MNFTLNIPLNSLSFGQTSIAICREIYKRGLSPCIFPIGNVDVSAQKPDNDFNLWLQGCLNKAVKLHDRNNPTIKLWHIQDLLQSFSKEQVAITFLETDFLTDHEVNIIKNQKTLFVTSNYLKNIAVDEYGLNNVKYLELGFDSHNFHVIDNKLNTEQVIFLLTGKWETRKAHEKILRAWVKKYGNNRKYMLHAALFNPFLKPEDQQRLLNNTLEGKRYWNINFLPYMQTNAEYNSFLNSGHIVIGCSRGEGRDLPVFHAVAMGKHCIGLRAHSYLDYLSEQNSTLINPTGKVKSHDGIFFHEGHPFSQGNFHDWDEKDFIEGCDLAVKRYESNPVNTPGLELQKRTYKNTVDTLLQET